MYTTSALHHTHHWSRWLPSMIQNDSYDFGNRFRTRILTRNRRWTFPHPIPSADRPGADASLKQWSALRKGRLQGRSLSRLLVLRGSEKPEVSPKWGELLTIFWYFLSEAFNPVLIRITLEVQRLYWKIFSGSPKDHSFYIVFDSQG